MGTRLRCGRFVVAALVLLPLLLAGCGVVLPDLTGLSERDAAFLLGDIPHTITYDPESKAKLWTIVAQSEHGRVWGPVTVDLTLAGTPPIEVPDVRSVEVSSAVGMLEDLGLVATQAPTSYDATVAAGSVISQTPEPGTTLQAGATIELVVSKGPEPPPSDTLVLRKRKTMTGPYSPKSVVASQNGYVFANNMIYRHTMTVFNDETYDVVKTIEDRVALADFGHTGYSGTVRGGPVEAAVTPDGAYMFVSQYSMYGPGFSHQGDDVGGPSSGVDPSFVYRIPTGSLEIDQVIKVGSVPKFLAVTPDGRYLLVSNWISYSVSVVDIAQGKTIKEIPVGRYPRGIAVSPDSKTAYIAVMGSTEIAMIDMASFQVSRLKGIGSGPRHLVMSPDGTYLYATLNGDGRIAKIATATGKVVARVATGSQPRSMTMAPDGRSLYIVNYASNTVSKVRTSDMKEQQEVSVGTHPIGITYVNATGEIWVACYTGSIIVFEDIAQ